MADLEEESKWEEGVYQFKTTDPVEGGPNGVDNKPTKQLANRTTYLKDEIEKVLTDKEIIAESTADKFVKLPQFWKGISHYVLNKLWLSLARKIFPVGGAVPWFTDVAPEGFVIMKNQAFDLIANPELAKVFPDGIIPDMRGCGVIGKFSNETIGRFEEGRVKEHGHPNSTVASVDLGFKNTNSKSTRYISHFQTYRNEKVGTGQTTLPSSGWSGARLTGDAGGGVGNEALRLHVSSENHSHSMTIGSHTHSIAIALFGALKNTIDHRKVNWIVRMA